MTEAEYGTGCPLCGAGPSRPFARLGACEYLECTECGLVSMVARHRLDAAAERAHYETHENDPTDAGYRGFLARLADPLAERLSPGAEGLDYGSGPGPTLSLMLQERGFAMETYDPFFAPDPAPLERTYDFVTCSETVEHLFHPGDELHRLDGLLRPGGWLGVMTEMLTPGRELAGWRYARDPTHVCFYRPATMQWISRRFGWSLELPHSNVALFRKPAGPSSREISR